MIDGQMASFRCKDVFCSCRSIQEKPPKKIINVVAIPIKGTNIS